MRVQISDGFAQAAVDKVFLDGVEQKLCVMADDTLGEIERYKTGSNGEILTIGERACLEAVVGTVVITFNEGWGMDPDGVYTLNGKRPK